MERLNLELQILKVLSGANADNPIVVFNSIPL